MQQRPDNKPQRPADAARKRFAEGVKSARAESEWSQRELAEELATHGLKIDPSAVTRIERGTRPVKVEEAWIIAEVLGTTVGDLLGESRLDPPEELEELRSDTNYAMNMAIRQMTSMLTDMAKVHELLRLHPDLLPALAADRPSRVEFDLEGPLSVPIPSHPDGYLAWVQKRMSLMTKEVVRVPSKEVGEDLRFIAATLAGLFDYKDPEAWQLLVASLDRDDRGNEGGEPDGE